ncbi:MAG: bifunctional demethylmenaquinone methyltransferase/2-methoxy-6-polyprenyl-1,4-benzoquinol methylase UbiE [Planctomycetes bacterium]|nr:bifunctional demethylmenaquinone methyltransferase/2-methoxy-6-polyprenyl-1,4-benzoquinol methylase UbiE [Planctomycetota bacterium]
MICESAINHQPSNFESVGPMFDRIAPTYDLLNHLLSFGRDYSWRRQAAAQIGAGGGLTIVDLATGTGDLLLSLLARHRETAHVVGLDISEGMLNLCREKLRRRGLAGRAELRRADAAATQLAENSFDGVTIGFGIRNTPDVPKTLREMHRILKPGGTAVILEFSLPRTRLWRWCYLQYLRLAVPFLGSVISADGQAYRYLNRSIEKFYPATEFLSLMRDAGFRDASVIPLTFGVASIYRGRKSPISE